MGSCIASPLAQYGLSITLTQGREVICPVLRFLCSQRGVPCGSRAGSPLLPRCAATLVFAPSIWRGSVNSGTTILGASPNAACKTRDSACADIMQSMASAQVIEEGSLHLLPSVYDHRMDVLETLQRCCVSRTYQSPALVPLPIGPGPDAILCRLLRS